MTRPRPHIQLAPVLLPRTVTDHNVFEGEVPTTALEFLAWWRQLDPTFRTGLIDYAIRYPTAAALNVAVTAANPLAGQLTFDGDEEPATITTVARIDLTK